MGLADGRGRPSVASLILTIYRDSDFELFTRLSESVSAGQISVHEIS